MLDGCEVYRNLIMESIKGLELHGQWKYLLI
jgi:hypothetical protein